VALTGQKTQSYSRSTAEPAKPTNRPLTRYGTIKRDCSEQSAKMRLSNKIAGKPLRTSSNHDAGGRNCRAQFIQSISFRKKRFRYLETILFNDPIDHGFIDFIEELNTVTLRAHRSNTTLCFEEFGVDEHRFVQSVQDEHARLPEGASTTG
jgi:hypothetical protein